MKGHIYILLGHSPNEYKLELRMKITLHHGLHLLVDIVYCQDHATTLESLMCVLACVTRDKAFISVIINDGSVHGLSSKYVNKSVSQAETRAVYSGTIASLKNHNGKHKPIC